MRCSCTGLVRKFVRVTTRRRGGQRRPRDDDLVPSWSPCVRIDGASMCARIMIM